MKIDLSGKTALVTGSTAGIGHAIAKGLAAAGASVVVNGRSQDKVDAAVRKLEAAGKVRGIAADVSTAAGCEALVAVLPEVDLLVNNAGIFEPKDFFEIPDEDWTRFFEVNVMSGVRLSRAYLKGMLERNWGRIVFVSSESALNIPVEMIHYGMTKTAQLAISSGEAKRLMSEVGRTFSKNSVSDSSNDLPSALASASTKPPAPRDLVGPGSTQLTVMPVPATASARPRDTASCAVLVMP